MADPLQVLPEDNLPDTSGISEDDRKDILDQIEKVSRENRLQATPEIFVLKPKKQGLMVPLAVNIGALVVLVLGLLILYFLFRQSAEGLVQNQVVLQSTEGKLLEELKKQSQTELLAKDQQIAEIQKQMASLSQQKNELQATMDQKIAAKEAELRQQLKDAVEAERERLTKAGFSQAVIEERLKEFERRRNAEFQKQLDDFKQKAESERAALEDNLKKQQTDYQQNLSNLANERQRILDDSKKKLSDLQSQLDQKNRDLENQQSTSRAQLAQAQQQLSDLNDQKAKTDSVQNQLLGLYTKIAQAIQSRQFPEAIKQVQGLSSYLNEPTVRSLPDIQKRRDTDLLLAQTLTDWLTQDQKRLDADASRVQLTESAIDTIQTLVQQGDAALAANHPDQAEGLYTKALSQLPAVLGAHQYFLDKALKAEQARQKAFADAVAAGDTASAAGKFQDALASYTLALDALPLTPAQKPVFASRLTQASYESELPNRTARLDNGASTDLQAAQALLEAGSAPLAMASFVAILGKYPVGQVGFASLAGIRQAATLLQQPSPRETALNQELSRVKAQLDQSQSQMKDIAKSKDDQAAANGANAAELQAAQKEAAQLRAQAAALNTMKAKFQEFVAKDNPLWSGDPTSAQVLQSKLLFNDFLGSPDVDATFPALASKVSRYERPFLQAGQTEGLVNASDAVANLSKLSSPEERKQYLSTLRQRYANNPPMAQFLGSLAALF